MACNRKTYSPSSLVFEFLRWKFVGTPQRCSIFDIFHKTAHWNIWRQINFILRAIEVALWCLWKNFNFRLLFEDIEKSEFPSYAPSKSWFCSALSGSKYDLHSINPIHKSPSQKVLSWRTKFICASNLKYLIHWSPSVLPIQSSSSLKFWVAKNTKIWKIRWNNVNLFHWQKPNGSFGL